MSRKLISFVSIIVVLGLAANVQGGAGPVGWWKLVVEIRRGYRLDR